MPAVSSAPLSYPGVTRPDGWDLAWRLAKASGGPAYLTVIGDSISAGQGSSDWLANSWVGRLKAKLTPRYGSYGDFWTFSLSNFSAGFSSASGSPFQNSAGTLPTVYQAKVLGKCAFLSSGVPQTNVVFTAPYACTGLDLLTYDFAPGTWQYAVDGGSAVVVTTTGSGSLVKTSLRGLASAAHTVAFGVTSAPNVCAVQGVTTLTGATSGVAYGRLAYTGAALSDLATATDPPDHFLQMQGRSAATGAIGLGFPAQPHLAILMLGVNDCVTAASVASYQDGLRRAIQALRRGRQNCSILVAMANFPDGVSSDGTTGSPAAAATWHTYLMAAQAMAAAYGCAFLNLHTRWGELGTGLGFQTGADIHPTDAGHADIAAAVAALL